jgi:hypothetical protein
MAESGDYLAGIDMPSSGSDEESEHSLADSGGVSAAAAPAPEHDCSGAGSADATQDGSAATPQAAAEHSQGICRQDAAPAPAGGVAEQGRSAAAATDQMSRLGVES